MILYNPSFQAAVKAMDAISEWNLENGRPVLDKWCVTGYDQYNIPLCLVSSRHYKPRFTCIHIYTRAQ